MQVLGAGIDIDAPFCSSCSSCPTLLGLLHITHSATHFILLLNGQRGYKLWPDTCNFDELVEIVCKWREAHRFT